MFNLSLLLNSDIMPEVSGAWASFFSGIGSFFVWLGSAILKGLASIAYVICKLVMGLIDFMQFLVQKLAGIEVYMNMEKFDVESLKQSDIVFRFLFSDAVSKVLKSVMVVFIVLLIVFTIFAIIKNEYTAAANGTGENLDHRKSWYAAFKAIITVILVPVLLITGIMGSNAILASIARAYNVSGNLTLGGQIFVASAYDASLYRNYAKNGVRKYTSNQVSFTYNGKTYTVNSALDVITPNSYPNNNPFSGYLFTYDGSTYYLCRCDATDEEGSGNSKIFYNEAYYYYLKYVLGAYIVEKNPKHDSTIQKYFEDEGYNTTNIPNDTTDQNKEIIDSVEFYYNLYVGKWVMTKIWDTIKSIGTLGLMGGDNAYICSKGFIVNKLDEEATSSLLIQAAYNTWSYNSIVATDLSKWDSQNVSLETHTDTFYTTAGRMRVATVVQNSASWGKLHDGGINGFHPLSVEYLAMADVMDFVLENGIELYYVNANNSNINYSQGGVTNEYKYQDNADSATRPAGLDGFLVDYKDVGRVAYEIQDNVVSELDGATYIVCYYDNVNNQYIPVVNGEKVSDSRGNKYEFKSSQYSSDYKGVVIARGMFKDSSQARATEPTYLTSTMVVGNKNTKFDNNVATAVKLDFLSDTTNLRYTYLEQLSTATSEDVSNKRNEQAGNFYWNGTKLVYYASGNNYEEIANQLVEFIVDEKDEDIKYTRKGSATYNSGSLKFDITKVGGNNQIYTVSVGLKCEDIVGKGGTSLKRFVATPRSISIKGAGETLSWHSGELFNYDVRGDIIYELVYEKNEDGSYKLDESGNKIPVYEIEGYETNEEGSYKTDEAGNLIPIYKTDPITGEKVQTKQPEYDSNGNVKRKLIKVYRFKFDRINNTNATLTLQTSDYDDGAVKVEIKDSIINSLGLTNVRKLSEDSTEVVYEVCTSGGRHFKLTFDGGLYDSGDDNTEETLIIRTVKNIKVQATYDYIQDQENPGYSSETKTNISYTDTTNKETYYTTNDKTGNVELFYVNTGESMENLADATKNIANAYIRDVLDAKYSGSAGVVELLGDPSYSGGVEFAEEEYGNLKVSFTVKVAESEATKNTNYYLIEYEFELSGRDLVKTEPEPEDNIYRFIFDSNYMIYNTYKAYENTTCLTSKIYDAGTKEYESTNDELILTIKDLSYKGTDEYILKEYQKTSKNEYVTIYQYTYSELGTTNSNVYTFNSLTGGDSHVDDGKKFITGEMSGNTFTPSFGITSDGEIKEDADSGEKDNTRKFVFVTGKMRILYTPDFSYIYQDGDNYVFVIADTQNVINNQTYFYTMTFNKTLEKFIWETKDGKTQNVTIKTYKVVGNDISYEASNDGQAKEYIKARVSMQVVNIDLHNYLDITKKEIESDANRYTTTVITDNGRSISLTATSALNNLPGDSSNNEATTTEPFSSLVMQQRLVKKANNFNDNLLFATIDYEDYSNAFIDITSSTGGTTATTSTSTADDTAISSVLEKVIGKISTNPISVVCCRDDVTTRQLVADFQLCLWSDTGGLTFVFRMPRFAFATAQKSSGDNVVLSLTKGVYSMDYNFEGAVALGNLYSVVDINYLILVFAIVIIFGILGKAVWGLIGRIYQITLLYLMMPVVASTLPLDEKGGRFESWKKQMITEVLSTYGVTIGLNFFFIMVPVIRESTQIFTEADFVNMSSTMKLFAGSPERLNYLCYILFLLVSFTLLKTVPKMVQEFTGYNKDVIESGAKLKADTVKTVNEASKKASNLITGKTLLDTWDKGKKNVKEIGAGIVPGKAIYDRYKDNQKKKEAAKKAAEEAKLKENQKLAMEHAHETADQAKARYQAAKERQAQQAQNQGAQAQNAQSAQQSQEATQAQNAVHADVSTDLDEATKQAIIQEAVTQSGEYTEVAMGMAEAAMEAADAQFGKTHDYVADREREEAEAARLAKEEEKYRKSGIGRAEAELEEAKAGNKLARLNATDIEEWNKTHKNAEDQISTERLDRSKFATEEAFREARRRNEENKYKARQEKAIKKAEAKLKDEKEGIRHGAGYSVLRTVVGGRKTWSERMKDAEKLEKASEKRYQKIYDLQEQKDKDISALEAEINNLNKTRASDNRALDKEHIKQLTDDSLVKQSLSKEAYEIYERRFNERMNDPNHKGGQATARQEALKSMHNEVNDMYDKNRNDLDKRREQIEKDYAKKFEKADKDYEKAEAKLAQDRKGWVYKAGSAINTNFIKPGLSKAAVPARWVAEKGRTFMYGASAQEKITAGQVLAEQRRFEQTLNWKESRLKDAEQQLANTKVKVADSAKYADFVKEYNNIKGKNTGNAKEMFDYLQKNRDKLQEIGFMNQQGLSKDFVNNKQKKSGWSETEKQKVVKSFNEFLKNSPEVSSPIKQRELEEAQRARDKAKQDLDMFNLTHKKAIEKAEKMRDGKSISSIGVTGVIMNSKPVKKAQATAQYVGQGFNRKKAQAQQAITDVKDAATQKAQSTQLYKTYKKVEAWHQDKQIAKARATAYTKANADDIHSKVKEKNKSVEDLIGKTLVERRLRDTKEVEKKLQSRLNKLQAKGNLTQYRELERLLKKYKAGNLSDDEKKLIDKYINYSAAKTKAKLNETANRQSRHTATVLSRNYQQRLINDLEKSSQARLQSLIRKELANMGMQPGNINAMLKKYNAKNTKELYTKMKAEVQAMTAKKQAEITKLMNSGKDTTKLIAEIKQLNALVGKMNKVDAKHRQDLRKLQESNRRLGKQLKTKKSSDAFSSAVNLQMNNKFTGGGSGKPQQ